MASVAKRRYFYIQLYPTSILSFNHYFYFVYVNVTVCLILNCLPMNFNILTKIFCNFYVNRLPFHLVKHFRIRPCSHQKQLQRNVTHVVK